MNTPKKTFQQSNRVKTTQTKSRYATVDGETGIQRDKTTGEYVVRLLCGTDRNGKQVRKFERFPTLKEARKRKEEFKAQKKLKQTPPPLEKITLGEYIVRYLEIHKEEKAETTNEYYAKIYKRIKEYKICKMHIKDIERRDIIDYMQTLKVETRLTVQTINKDLGFLKTVFKDALKNEYIVNNPTSLIDNLKVVNQFQGKSYTEEEVLQIISYLKNYPNRNIRILFYMGLCFGLRRGEIMGLKWENIDFSKNTITINNNRVVLRNKTIDKSPKTKDSERKLTLEDFPFIIEELKSYRNWQIENFPDSLYVMINPYTGKPLTARGLNNGFNTFITKCNVRRLRIHDLRHTFATICRHKGATIEEISKALGHSDTRITKKIYVHKTDTIANKIANKAFASIFDEKPEK